jgi:hypothetical protein
MWVRGPRAGDWHEDYINAAPYDFVFDYRRIGCTDPTVANVYVNETPKKLGRTPESVGFSPTAVWCESGREIEVLIGPLTILGPIDERGVYLPLTEEGLAEVKRHIVPFEQRDQLRRDL